MKIEFSVLSKKPDGTNFSINRYKERIKKINETHNKGIPSFDRNNRIC